jgi:hypothetical protein
VLLLSFFFPLFDEKQLPKKKVRFLAAFGILSALKLFRFLRQKYPTPGPPALTHTHAPQHAVLVKVLSVCGCSGELGSAPANDS